MVQVKTTERTADEALRLWRHLFGGEPGGMLQIASWTRSRDGTPQDVQQHAFPYPRGASVAAEWALEQADAGRETYFCSHLLTQARRVKQNAAPVRALWADLDGAEPPDGGLKPTALVESSPGHWHAYWRLSRALAPDEAERLNRRITYAIGADRGKWALASLLRVPQTTNGKRDEPHTVKLAGLDARREADPDALAGAAPPPRGEAGAGASGATSDSAANGSADGASQPQKPPPVALGAGALATWRGERPKRKPGGDVDRSASLYGLGRVLVGAGLHPVWLPPVLAERDRALGWDTYAHRPSEYARIARKLAHDAGEDSGTTEGNTYTHGTGSTGGRRRVLPVSLAGRDAPEPQGWHVAGLVPEGFTTTFYGEGGIAKSLAVLHMLMSIAFEGVDNWMGRRVWTCPVLALDFEMDYRTQLSRAKRIATGAGWPDVPRGFEYVAAVDHDPADVFAYAVEWLEGLDAGIVAIDSYGFAMAGESEKSADVLRFHREHVAPIHRAGGTTVAVDHIPRPQRGERAGEKDPFGSVYKTNAARSVVNATGYQDGPGAVVLTLAHRKINVGPKIEPFGLRVVFDGADGPITFEPRGADEQQPPPTAQDRLLAAYADGAELTADEAGRAAGMPQQTARNAAGALKKDRLLEETGDRREGANVLRAT